MTIKGNKERAENFCYDLLKRANLLKGNAHYLLGKLDENIIDDQDEEIDQLQILADQIMKVHDEFAILAKYWGDDIYNGEE